VHQLLAYVNPRKVYYTVTPYIISAAVNCQEVTLKGNIITLEKERIVAFRK